MQDISRSQLITRLDSLSNTPGEQSHASVTFNVFLNWCVNNGHLTENPIANIRKQGHVKQRNRILTDAELKQVFQHAQAVEKPFGTIVQLLILTGLRRGEVVALQPEWVGDAVITIPASHTKNGREHTLPFGNITEPLMRELPLTFNGWGKSKKRFDTALEIEPYTLHDLRRTFASNHARLGAPIHVVEKLLNHVSGSLAGVAGVYNRYNYLDEMTNACSQYEEWLQKLISGS